MVHVAHKVTRSVAGEILALYPGGLLWKYHGTADG
jgi:hypothetical protein